MISEVLEKTFTRKKEYLISFILDIVSISIVTILLFGVVKINFYFIKLFYPELFNLLFNTLKQYDIYFYSAIILWALISTILTIIFYINIILLINDNFKKEIKNEN